MAAKAGFCSPLFLALAAASTLILAACSATQDERQESAAPSRSAPYAVGSQTLFIHDPSRPFDRVGGIEDGVRTLITELWYPVDPRTINENSPTRATFGDYVFGNRAVHQRMMTETTFFHLTPDTVRAGVSQDEIDEAIEELFHRQRPSYRDATPAAGGPWPVVVLSHGDAGSRYNMQTLATALVQSGYVVIAPEHTGNTPYTMLGSDPALATDPDLRNAQQSVLARLDDNGVYGHDTPFGQSYAPQAQAFTPTGISDLDRALTERVNDLRAVLDELEQLNAAGPFAGRLALDQVGLAGRSFGGATTLAAVAMEPRFRAGFAVVPPPLPDLRPLLPKEMLVSAPAESVLLSAGGALPFQQFSKPTFILAGEQDALILGLSAALAAATGTGAPTIDVPYAALQAAVDTSTAPVAYALVPRTNHASFGVSGAYWWPSLKPQQLPDFFAPGESYTLLPAATAHELQAEMAQAFFDLELKGDEDGKELLRENPWAKQGTRLQLRGFGD